MKTLNPQITVTNNELFGIAAKCSTGHHYLYTCLNVLEQCRIDKMFLDDSHFFYYYILLSLRPICPTQLDAFCLTIWPISQHRLSSSSLILMTIQLGCSQAKWSLVTFLFSIESSTPNYTRYPSLNPVKFILRSHQLFILSWPFG